ncbi:MAG: helix-turn-helix domain-containing protein [Acidimicrobiales bacterium]
MPAPQARDRLLAAAVEHALGDGIADLSLRQLAAAIGTSHRMLIYHFGSREGLLVAVTGAVEEREREMLLGAGIQVADPRQEWHRLSSPDLWPQERLFFELYSHALRGRPGTEGFLDGVVESWVGPIANALVEAGTEPGTARADARLGVAVVRGLLLDLLATGERREVDEAFERYLQLTEPTSHVRVPSDADAPPQARSGPDPGQRPVVAG